MTFQHTLRVVALFLCIALSHEITAQSKYVSFDGQILRRNDSQSVPGLRAVLLHQSYGKSSPSYTDRNGRFGWNSIRSSEEPYYIEVYWDSRLLFRKSVIVNQSVSDYRVLL
jgi:hypothetical protein